MKTKKKDGCKTLLDNKKGKVNGMKQYTISYFKKGVGNVEEIVYGKSKYEVEWNLKNKSNARLENGEFVCDVDKIKIEINKKWK